MPTHPEQPDSSMIADGWQVVPDTDDTPTPARRGTRRRLAGIAVVTVLSLALFGLASVVSGGNQASAMAGHPEKLREGCTWDSSGNYVQNCKVWSESQGKFVTVQIRASNGSDQGVYLLDGMRAQEDRSAWTKDVQAAKVYDGSTDTTLVMPVGGASSFYTDWDGGAGGQNTVIKQETFLTEELPDYLAENFGVSKNNNAIIGLSMSGGPAVTLAERHPDQFKVVQAMSGYYQIDNPIGALGVFASQTIVSNYTNGIVNMWGQPGSQRWTDNDPSKNVGKLAENGQVLIISSGNGFLTNTEMAHLSEQDQITSMALEILSAVSTVLMQLQAAQTGASVISLPNYGGHTWENWDRGLADGKDHVLAALRNNPPVTAKVQVVDAAGSPDPEGTTKATQAALAAAKSTPVLDVVDLAGTPSDSSSASESASSESAQESTAPESSAPQTSADQTSAAQTGESNAPDAGVVTSPAAPTTSEPAVPSVPEVPVAVPSTTTTTTPAG
ncbi:alpha/beta hydrolase [Gordonia sesuvii]